LLKYFFIHCNGKPQIPYSNLSKIILWFTVSKALDRSKKIPTEISFLSIALEILSYKCVNANEVE
jgi:hypothetical protein